jgi:nitrite reductase (NADH) large subunit
MRYIIIGAGITGISAAKTLRAQDPAGEILVYTTEFHPMGFYDRKNLARRLAKGIQHQDEFLLDTIESLKKDNIKLEYKEIERVFPAANEVLFPHSIRLKYDRLLLALGATPKIVEAPGVHLIGVHQLRTFDDAWLVEQWIPELRENGAVVIGGGLLGLDMAYALKERGVRNTLVVRESYVGAPWLPERAAQFIEKRLQLDGIEVITGETVTAYLSEDERVLDAVQFSNGHVIPARMAFCAVGVRLNTDLAEEGVIEVNETSGAIVVNEYLQTNYPNVYAAGNCASVNGLIAHNWTLSTEQGHIAALNMAGQTTPYQPAFIGDLNSQIYDLPFAYFGDTSRTTSHTQVWVWENGNDQFVEVILNEGKIVGATLLGNVTALAIDFAERYQSQTPISTEELASLVHSAATQPAIVH